MGELQRGERSARGARYFLRCSGVRSVQRAAQGYRRPRVGTRSRWHRIAARYRCFCVSERLSGRWPDFDLHRRSTRSIARVCLIPQGVYRRFRLACLCFTFRDFLADCSRFVRAGCEAGRYTIVIIMRDLPLGFAGVNDFDDMLVGCFAGDRL